MGKLFSNPRLTTIALVALIVFFISFLGGAIGAGLGLGFLSGPIPFIQLPAELVVEVAGYQIMNTYLMFWLAGIVLLVLTYLATRNIKDVPGRMQGIFESFFEFSTDMAESAAGGRRGRMFLPVVTAIFLIVLFSNWLGTLPGVGSIGRIETIEDFVHHHFEDELKGHEGGDALADQLEDEGLAPFLETHGENEVVQESLLTVLNESSDEKFVVFTGNSGLGTIPPGRGEDAKVLLSDVVEFPPEGTHLAEEQVTEIAEQIESGTVLPGHAPEDFQDLEGGRAGLLVPFLRGASTDLNTTLAVAIFAMVSVQFWGFRTLGFKGYAGKFFINPLRDPIGSFVGVLELLGEGIKIISFTFRLFGNMFAGEILLVAMGFLLPLIGIIPFLGLELFVGVIQAVIFSVLTLIFGSIAIIAHEHHEAEHAEEAHH